jgi:GH25 family lysozyme M1 (1,4-beta-N-acetylmuramidase)
VLDVYGPNRFDCAVLAREPRVAGIIHKATEGFKADTEGNTIYAARKAQCKRLGYKWGSYHLGRPGDPVKQADFYLATAQPTEDEVIALDLENVRDSRFMDLSNAEGFIKRIKEKTGRYPLLYITGSSRDALLREYGTESEFANAPLWYVRIRRDISNLFPAKPLWNSYTLWQFASELNCCHERGKKRICTSQPPASCPFRSPIPGTNFDMDVNIYYGTAEELRSKWPFTAK